jgi:hypothetical protein
MEISHFILTVNNNFHYTRIIFQHPVASEVTHVCFLPSLMQLFLRTFYDTSHI